LGDKSGKLTARCWQQAHTCW